MYGSSPRRFGTTRWLDDVFRLPASATRNRSQVTITLQPTAGSPAFSAARYAVDNVVAPFTDTAAPAAVDGLAVNGVRSDALHPRAPL